MTLLAHASLRIRVGVTSVAVGCVAPCGPGAVSTWARCGAGSPAQLWRCWGCSGAGQRPARMCPEWWEGLGPSNSALRQGRVGAAMGTSGEMTPHLSFVFLVCVLIENLSLSKMPFRGDVVIGKCFSLL